MPVSLTGADSSRMIELAASRLMVLVGLGAAVTAKRVWATVAMAGLWRMVAGDCAIRTASDSACGGTRCF
jgi:hypothetical protein